MGHESRIYYYKYFDPGEKVMVDVSIFELDPATFRLKRQIQAQRAVWQRVDADLDLGKRLEQRLPRRGADQPAQQFPGDHVSGTDRSAGVLPQRGGAGAADELSGAPALHRGPATERVGGHAQTAGAVLPEIRESAVRADHGDDLRSRSDSWWGIAGR